MTQGTLTGRPEGRTYGQLERTPVTQLSGLSPKKADALHAFGVDSILDLLTTYPRRHIDRSRQIDVADFVVGEQAGVTATVEKVTSRRMRNGRAMVEVVVGDATGTLKVVFFNQPWRAKQLPIGTQALFFGKLDTYRGQRQISNPIVDVLSQSGTAGRRTGRIVAVYPASEKAGLSSFEIGNWVEEALGRAGEFADPLPEANRKRLRLTSRTAALQGMHLPETEADIAPARRRLAFDELFRLQLALVMRRRRLEAESRGIRHLVDPAEIEAAATKEGHTLLERFLAGLPFTLTGAQTKAIEAIVLDLAGPLPMHRLLQGDVGSGKTIVALSALLAAVQGGHQGAFMVPTEVLAEQHYAGLVELTATLEVDDDAVLGGRRPMAVKLLTNRTTAAERVRLHEGLRSSGVDIVVGTHALLTDEVRFRSLGAVVIDEQHRFGVEQRAALREKGRDSQSQSDPDLLVMTATPIPRTAAMVVFGDLEMTTLDELPPGRRPVITTWARDAAAEAEAWAKVRAEVSAGHRCYVVCPLVEGSDRVVARSATEEFDRLAAEELAGLRLGLMHGQLAAADKDATMAAFRSGALDVLVATTVIEVGVDVPDATVMVILDADRFGIAQLHQLRGRVGRSDLESWCYLLSGSETPESIARLEAMESTNDGFELAEVDLRLRGEGAILGTRQKGRSDLQLAKLSTHRDLLDKAREVAVEIVDDDPNLSGHVLLGDELRLFLDEEEAEFLFKS